MISIIIKTEVYVFCRSRKLSCHVGPPDHTFYEIFITPPSISNTGSASLQITGTLRKNILRTTTFRFSKSSTMPMLEAIHLKNSLTELGFFPHKNRK